MPAYPYPVNLDLDGRPVLVVGGGRVAAAKATGLADAGARVTVVAPEAVSPLTDDPRFHWQRRPYHRGEVASYRLAVAATGDPVVDGRVHRDAEAAGVWLNSADDPAHCTFTLPAVSRHGDLQVAVSTNGRSPAVAAWIRRLLDRWIRPEHARVLALASEVRGELREATGTTESPGWEDAFDDQLLEMVRGDQTDAARERLRRAVGLVATHEGAVR